MNYKKHTLLLVSAVVLLSAGIAGVAMAQSVLFDKDIDLQGTKKILNAADIGIGTTSPARDLDVRSTGTTYAQILGTGDDYINAGIILHSADDNSDYRGGGIFLYQQTSQKEWYIGSPYAASDSLIIARKTAVASHDVTLAQDTYALLKINSAGYVGIGTTNPSARLTISPVSSISADMLSGRIQNLASPVNTADAATKNYVDTVAAGGTLWTLGATELNIYTTNSRGVGIGTAIPLHKLDIIGSYYSRTVVKGTCSGTVAIDWTQGNTQHCVLGSTPVTFTFSGAQSGGNYKLILKQDGTGSRTVSWPATIRWGSGSAPYLTPTPLKTDYVGFIYNGIDGYYDSVAFNANF